MNASQDKANILNYWCAVEHFQPQKIPKFSPNDKNAPVFKIGINDLMPWDNKHSIQKRVSSNENLRIRHVVYGGIYLISKVKENIEAVFGKDVETFDERSDGETCLFTIQLTQTGRPLFETFVLSMCSWALGRLKKPGPKKNGWLEGFESKMDKYKRYFEQHFAVQKDDKEGIALKEQGINVGRSITISEILSSIVEMQKGLGVKHLDINLQHCLVNSIVVHKKNAFKADEADFLNSFFVKDLSRIATAAIKNRLSTALTLYLTNDIDEKNRIDLRKLNSKDRFTYLSPNKYPRGCWPTKNLLPLVYAQQFAINTAIESLSKDTKIFSVNGPPGTGKTTLLRDLIAAVIVERAMKLSKLSDPKEAFEGMARWKSDSSNRRISMWKKEFLGFEIVIASSNNSAVENVTLEIPGLDAIDEMYLQKTNYFSDIASEILDKKSWALLAAKLGNKNNRTLFKNKFWAYPEYPSNSKDKKDKKIEKPSFYKFLLKCKTNIAYWNEAVKRFKLAIEQEELVRQERQILYEKYQTILTDDFLVLDEQIKQVEENLYNKNQEFDVIEESLRIETEKKERLIDQRMQLRQFKPGIIEIIFSFCKAYTNWQNRDLEYQKSIHEKDYEIDKIHNEIISYKKELIEIKNHLCQEPIAKFPKKNSRKAT